MITAKPIQWLAATESSGPLFHCHGCSPGPTLKSSYCQDFLRQEIILPLERKIQFLHCQIGIDHLQCQVLKLLPYCQNSQLYPG